MVIELPTISQQLKTVEELNQTQESQEGTWTKLERSKMDCIWALGKLLLAYLSFYQLANHSHLLRSCHLIANVRLMLCQFDI